MGKSSRSGGIDIADWIGSGATKEDIFDGLKGKSEKFIDDAITIKERLEKGLEKLDKLENVLLRTCALETLKKELGLTSGNIFDKLVNTLIRENENNEPEDFEAIMASDDGLKPVIDDLLAVGLTLWV